MISQTHRVSGDGRGWVDTLTVPLFAANGTSYISISPLRDGSSGYFRHIVHVHVAKKRVLPLTHGQYEVKQLLHWDQVNNWMLVFFPKSIDKNSKFHNFFKFSFKTVATFWVSLNVCLLNNICIEYPLCLLVMVLLFMLQIV